MISHVMNRLVSGDRHTKERGGLGKLLVFGGREAIVQKGAGVQSSLAGKFRGLPPSERYSKHCGPVAQADRASDF